jgi:hypothetical protein
VDELVVDNVMANTHIEFMITNFEINPVEPTITKSWEVTMYTPDDFFIETRDQGFSLEFKCAVPCLTCKVDQPDSCTSCNTLTGLSILYLG